ncbi:AAA family ATPase [Dermatobacter hominis]|uniref:AAA family ATPase n=1 Tax=Dermatobacter hominis TaxID=2884263 RepID=UPI001D10C12E|nr:AAA family ATPase [Dermatobacter hominis]UDY36034.1 AAA family ATPase [Dermatobacter hominis]
MDATDPDGPARPSGRYEELHLCERWLGEAIGGRMRVLLVEGEADVGKTTLLRSTLDLAAARGAVVGRGTFQPADVAHRGVVEALRPVLPPDALPDRGLDAVDDVERRSPERTMAELFTGTARALVDAARERPVAIGLDDLQWADRPSIDLLGLLLAGLVQAGGDGPLPLFVVMAGRVAEDAVGTSTRLASLRRYPGSRHLLLQAPSEAALGQILSDRFGVRPSPRLLRAVHSATGGRPLHAEMHVRGAIARGDVQERRGVLVDGPGYQSRSAHRTLDDEVVDLLDVLAEEERELLVVAACLGTAGATATLQAAAAPIAPTGDLPVERLLKVEELIEVDEHWFRFRHAEVHRAVLRTRPRPLRAQLHCRTALALWDALPRNADTIALVDRQLRLGGDDVDPRIVFHVARAVGDGSLGTAAWSDASLAYERAIAAAERIGVDADTMTELQLRAGHAAAHDHDAPTASEHYGCAIDLARAAGDTERWARAALGLGRARLTSGSEHLLQRAPIDELHSLVEALGSDGSEIGARCQELLAEIAFSAGDYGDGFACIQRARDLAVDAPDVLALVDFAEGLQFMGALQLDRAEELFRRSHDHALQAGDTWVGLWGLTRTALVLLLRGDVEGGDTAARIAAAASSTLGNWAEHAIALACTAWAANLRGEFHDAEERALEAAEFVQRSDYTFGPLMVFPQLAWSRAVRGDWTGSREALDDWAATGARGVGLTSAVIRAALAPDDDRGPTLRTPEGMVTINSILPLAGCAEMARHRGDAEGLASLAGELTAVANAGTRCVPFVNLFVDRFSAYTNPDAPQAAVADRLAGAAERAARLGLAVEAARATMDRAEVIAPSDPERAGALAGAALDEFHRMDALALAVRAERWVAGLGDALRPSAAPSPLSRTILFTDIVESTRRNAEVGDATFLELLRSHNDLMRGRLREFSGTEFKHTGDGIAAWFRNADDAAGYSLAVQHDLDVLQRAEPEMGLQVRMGLAAGVPLENEGDLFGLAVVRAARICDRAHGGQVLAGDEVVRELDPDRWLTVLVGKLDLKGLPGPVAVHRVSAAVG